MPKSISEINSSGVLEKICANKGRGEREIWVFGSTEVNLFLLFRHFLMVKIKSEKAVLWGSGDQPVLDQINQDQIFGSFFVTSNPCDLISKKISVP